MGNNISFVYLPFYFCFLLIGLALASLLTVQNDSIYQRFEIIMQCICETLNDIMKEDADDPTILVE